VTVAASELVGAWALELCEARDDAGHVMLPLGPSPAGVLVYAQAGVMSVAIMREGRPRFAAGDIMAGTDTEKARAAESYLSYAGRWELAGDRMHHHVDISLFPNWVGDVQERRVTLDGDVLELATDPITLDGRTRVARMRWRRI